MDIPSLPASFKLEPGTALSLPPIARGATLVVSAGRVWLTDNTGLDDHFIAAGQTFRLSKRGQVVVECDSGEAARIELQRVPAPGKQRRHAAGSRHLLDARSIIGL